MHDRYQMINPINRRQIICKQNQFIDSEFGTPAPEKLTIVEVGSLKEYLQRHIPKAIYLPLDSIVKGARPWLPNLGAQIIVYSSIEESELSRLAVESLYRQGYMNLFHYREGKEDWMNAERCLTDKDN